MKTGLVLIGLGIAGRIYSKSEKEGTLREQSTSIKGVANLLMFIGGAVTIFQIIKNK
jgi:hypothetical protein